MKTGEFRVIRSKKISVLAKLSNQFTELFQIIFYSNSKNQMALFVTFPYFKDNKGIVSKLVFPGGMSRVDSLSLSATGSVTSHLVKYSHWEDGNVHFSQDDKVYTNIRNRSTPLDIEAGHIFSIQLQGLSGFTKRDTLKKLFTTNKTDIDFAINNDFKALKFTGWWLDSTGMTQNMKVSGPQMQIKLKDGTYKTGFALASPKPKFPETFLFLSCENIPLLNRDDESLLTFVGGFDKSTRFEEDAAFLSFIYPVTNYEELIQKIPTIDRLI